MPILAICRGTQALNIVRGGTLHQHLPELSTEIAHRQRHPGDEPSHPVEIEPGSRLAAALDGRATRSTSTPSTTRRSTGSATGSWSAPGARRHDRGGRGPEPAFLIGVQWHAETLVHRPYEAALFQRFVEACRDDGAEFQRRSGREVA